MSQRFLTLLIVPHDERDVRRLRLSYRAIQILVAAALVLGSLTAAALVTWGRTASRAVQVELLKEENRRLLTENAKVTEIAANVERTEQAYRQIRSMAGLEQGSDISRAVGTPVLGDEARSTWRGSAEPAPARSPSEHDGGRPRPSGWPLTIKGFVTAEYTGGRSGHPGIDIAAPMNTPVVATAAGRVERAGRDSIYGRFVVLSHAGAMETVYGHNAHLLVARGERVEWGQIIAYSGNSGRSSAPHLHYEIRREGWPVDPTPFLR